MILSNTELEGILREQSQNISLISKYISEHPSHSLFDISANLRDISEATAVISNYVKTIDPLLKGTSVTTSQNLSDITMLINVNQSLHANVSKMQSFLNDWIAASYAQSNQIFTALNSLAVMQENNNRQIEQIQKSLCEIGDNLEFQAIFDEEIKLLLSYLVKVSPKPGNLNNNPKNNNNSGKAIKSLAQAVE